MYSLIPRLPPLARNYCVTVELAPPLARNYCVTFELVRKSWGDPGEPGTFYHVSDVEGREKVERTYVRLYIYIYIYIYI